MRKIIVTSALPYANGPIHLGHMVEFIQTDIWKRFQQLIGNQCVYIWGSDAHGTPIMLRAEKEGITPEQLVSRIHQEHTRDFDDFHISYDNFYTTHSPENNELVCEIYRRLRDRGDIEIKTIIQAFDPIKNIFLPDRFVKGECPRCSTKDQYGDNCEHCGATYTPMELKNPRSVLSDATPIEKESEHYFFKLPNHEQFLREWTKEHIPPTVANKLDEWFTTGLQNWDISRDAPYFGFPIPDAPKGDQAKYFCVWLDAPIGYMASFKNLCSRRPDLHFDEYWSANSKTELHHFIGKDIMYFHALFWPATLHGAGYRTPTAIHTHGFLTVNGQKMSKSRGTFVKARTYLNHLDPEYLRYYFATKLTDSVEDIDLNFEDFRLRINSDLIGKYINIASRCAGFITKNFNGQLSAELVDAELFSSFVAQASSVALHYENRDYSRAMREIMLLADKANQYIADKAPWTLAKNPDTVAQVQAICTLGLNLFRVLTIYLKPVLPKLTEKVETFFNVDAFNWQDHAQPLLAHTINQFVPLMSRIEETQIAALIQSTKEDVI